MPAQASRYGLGMPVSDLFDLSGRSAIVTGGGTGLGRQLAEALAEAGANVAICGRNAERCAQVASELEQQHGVKVIGLGCDVRAPDQIQAVVDNVEGAFGSVDILVNNAGTSWGAPAEEYPLEGWRKVLDVNLTGVFLFSQAAGRIMIGRRYGRIINIASVAAFVGAAPELMDAVAYNASKGGVVALTRDLAVKWARHGINVNAIAPGWFPSDMTRVLLERSGSTFLKRIPLERFGGPEDLKGAIVFLAGQASDFITGHTLVVDGGQSAA
jgi:gluconate 5-dehydrogenase